MGFIYMVGDDQIWHRDNIGRITVEDTREDGEDYEGDNFYVRVSFRDGSAYRPYRGTYRQCQEYVDAMANFLEAPPFKEPDIDE